MRTQSVRPNNGSREGRWVFFIISVVLLATLALLPINQTDTSQRDAEMHQIDALQLTPATRSLVADLKIAAKEIRDSAYLDESNSNWPTPEQLARQWIAPFVLDKSWQHYGEHRWELVDDGIYRGIRGRKAAASNVILICHQTGSEIWISSESSDSKIPQRFTTDQFIAMGWRQVVSTNSKTL